MIISKKKRKQFIEILSKTGRVSAASRAVGYTSSNFLRKVRKEDEDFALEWDMALEAAADHLAEVAIERAENGTLEPVYYKGDVVGHKVNYSDSLLMFVLRKLDPSYRDSAGRGETNLNFGIAILPMTAPNETDWETRAQLMHGAQEPLVIEAKPIENNMVRTKRGD
jgi:hypothetical protein